MLFIVFYPVTKYNQTNTEVVLIDNSFPGS